MSEQKTIREWLEKLPDGYRELALKYYNPKYHDECTVNRLPDAILETCHWRISPEGFEFWKAVDDWALGYGELPSLPEEEEEWNN